MYNYPFNPAKVLTSTSLTYLTNCIYFDGNYYTLSYYSGYKFWRVRTENISMDMSNVVFDDLFETIFTSGGESLGDIKAYSYIHNNTLYFWTRNGSYKIYQYQTGGNVTLAYDLTTAFSNLNITNSTIEDMYIDGDNIYVVSHDKYYKMYLFKKLGEADWTSTEIYYYPDKFYYPDMNFINFNGKLYICGRFTAYYDDLIVKFLLIDFNTLLPKIELDGIDPYYIGTNSDIFIDFSLDAFDTKEYCKIFNNKLYMIFKDKIYVMDTDENYEILSVPDEDTYHIYCGFIIYDNKLFIFDMVPCYQIRILYIDGSESIQFSTLIDEYSSITNIVTTGGEFLINTYRAFHVYNPTTIEFERNDVFNLIAEYYPEIIVPIGTDYYFIYSGGNTISSVLLPKKFILNSVDTECNSNTSEIYYKKDYAIKIDKQLTLDVDVSGSIDELTEFDKQMLGYSTSIKNVSTYFNEDNIVAMTMHEWSSYNQWETIIPWKLIYDENSAYEFADLVDSWGRNFYGQTATIMNLLKCDIYMRDNIYIGDEKIIDISSDGCDNQTPKDLFYLRPGNDIKINSITLENSTSYNCIKRYYENDIIQGNDPFSIDATSFVEFGVAMEDKLIRELTPEEPEETINFDYVGGINLNINMSVVSRLVIPVSSININIPYVNPTEMIDLQEYVNQVPPSQALFLFFSNKGEDNKIKLIPNRHDFIQEFGEPNILDFGQPYGQQMYNIYNYLGEQSAYVARVLPNNACYANLRLDAFNLDTTSDITVSYHQNMYSVNSLDSKLTNDGTTYPICFFYTIGRGRYYNAISIKLRPGRFADKYTLDIYERHKIFDKEGEDVIIESLDISFDQNSKNSDGDSDYVVHVLETYSNILRCKIGQGYEYVCKVYDRNIGHVSLSLNPSITDDRQNFADWAGENDQGNYVIWVTDDRGYQLWGWLGEVLNDNSTINVYVDKSLTTRGWNTINDDLNMFDTDSELTYVIKKNFSVLSSAFISDIPVSLKYGSDGSIRNLNGTVNDSAAIQTLSNAYSGNMLEPIGDSDLGVNIFDIDYFDFSLVFDGPYPTDVKNNIVNLVNRRRDCVAILDNDDNLSVSKAVDKRLTVHNFNSYLVSIYEGWNKIYDDFTGRDIWVSPLYHLSYLIPKNDNVNDVWTAVAGLNRTVIDSIKDLRYHTNDNSKDLIYQNRLNPIIKMRQGICVWGQLMTDPRPTSIQDLNIVRLYLYVKKAIEGYCRTLIFEDNDKTTWSRVAFDITEFLEEVKKRRGLYDYMVEVFATPYQIKRKEFTVNVIIQPTKIVEKIRLNLFIK